MFILEDVRVFFIICFRIDNVNVLVLISDIFCNKNIFCCIFSIFYGIIY